MEQFQKTLVLSESFTNLTFNCLCVIYFDSKDSRIHIPPCLEWPSSLAPCGRFPPSWLSTRVRNKQKPPQHQISTTASSSVLFYVDSQSSFRSCRPVLHPRNLGAYSQGYCHKDLRATNKICWGLFHKLALNQIEQNKPIPLVMYLFDAAPVDDSTVDVFQNYNQL